MIRDNYLGKAVWGKYRTPRKIGKNIDPELLTQRAAEGMTIHQLARSFGLGYGHFLKRVRDSVTLTKALAKGRGEDVEEDQ